MSAPPKPDAILELEGRVEARDTMIEELKSKLEQVREFHADKLQRVEVDYEHRLSGLRGRLSAAVVRLSGRETKLRRKIKAQRKELRALNKALDRQRQRVLDANWENQRLTREIDRLMRSDGLSASARARLNGEI